MNVEMAVHALAVSTEGGPCAIVLRGVRLPVMLPIAISAPQAAAIAAVRFQFRRPLSHDLACNLLSELRATAERVVIHDVQGSTFIARLEISKEGQEHAVDSRPSDAIAIAVRLNLPVIVTSDVLSRAEGVRWGKEGEEGGDPSQSGDEQRSRSDQMRSEPHVSAEQLAPFRDVIETLDLENL